MNRLADSSDGEDDAMMDEDESSDDSNAIKA